MIPCQQLSFTVSRDLHYTWIKLSAQNSDTNTVTYWSWGPIFQGPIRNMRWGGVFSVNMDTLVGLLLLYPMAAKECWTDLLDTCLILLAFNMNMIWSSITCLLLQAVVAKYLWSWSSLRICTFIDWGVSNVPIISAHWIFHPLWYLLSYPIQTLIIYIVFPCTT